MDEPKRNTESTNQTAFIKCDEKRNPKKIYKKLKLRDFHKSPRSQQSNKISSWLSIANDKKISDIINKELHLSTGINIQHSEHARKSNEMRDIDTLQNPKEKEQTGKKSAEKFKVNNTSERGTVHECEYKEEKSHNNKRKLYNGNVTPTKQDKKNEEVIPRRSPRIKNSTSNNIKEFKNNELETDILRDRLNITPTKQKPVDDIVLRTSPRCLHHTKSSPNFTPKKLFTNCDILSSSKINIVTKYQAKNVDQPEVDNCNSILDSTMPSIVKGSKNHKLKSDSLEDRLMITPTKKKNRDVSILKTSPRRLQISITSDPKRKKGDKSNISENTDKKKNHTIKEFREKRHDSRSQENIKPQLKRQKLDLENLKIRSDRNVSIQNNKKNPREGHTKSSSMNRDKNDNKSDKRKEKIIEEKINKWFTKQPKKKDNVVKSGDRCSSKSTDTETDNACKMKGYNLSNSQDNIDSNSERQMLNLENSSKKIEGNTKRSDKNKKTKKSYEKPSNKTHTKDENIGKVKSKEKFKERGKSDSSKKTKKHRTEIRDKAQRVHKKQEKLDKFVKKKPKDKSSKTTKLSRTESSESYDLPSIDISSKKSKGSGKSSESFKKYGVAVPTIEEILKEQKDLEKYKNQIEAFQDIDLESFNLPFSVNDLNKADVNKCTTILGCKHLTTEQITELFKKNLPYISDIFHGRKKNERHDKFFSNINKSYTLTIKDLTYSTSTIVFSYEQKEDMIKLLKEEFDPENKWTPYFFQVLLPELCLKIFMDVHEMTYDEAVKYLDIRPIIDD